MGYREKIVDVETAADAVAEWRGAGLCVVFANGCFDVLHVGHVRYLTGAAGLGQKLVVGVNADAGTRALKGNSRPILPERARAELVAGLGCVDLVVIFPETTVERLLRRLRPEVHAKGTDYTVETVPEAGVARELGIRVAIAGDAKAHSTRELLARVQSDAILK